MTMDTNNHQEPAGASPTRATTSPSSQPSSTEQSPTPHDAARSKAQLGDNPTGSHNTQSGEPHSEAGKRPATRPDVVRDLSESTTTAAAGSSPSARPTDQPQVDVSDRSANGSQATSSTDPSAPVSTSPSEHVPPRAADSRSRETISASPERKTEAGHGAPPRLPPASEALACPDEPDRSNRSKKPPLDIEAFVQEAEDRKRGARTLQEIRSLADDIKQLHERGVPFGAIHRGLKERALISCSRSRFDEICADLFPDLVKPSRRGNG